MKVSIRARNCRVAQYVQRMAERQVGRLSKFHVRARSADVIFSEEKRTREVEVVMRIEGGPSVVARGEAHDFRTALDQVVGHLSRKLRRLRDRDRDHQAQKPSALPDAG